MSLQENDGERCFIPANTDAHAQRALEELKQTLGCTSSNSLDVSVDMFLLRYLAAVRFSAPDAVTLLRQRRSFEVGLSSLRVTAPILQTLRSGAVSIMGRDVFCRPILYIRTKCVPTSFFELEDMQRLLVMLMEYMISHCVHPSKFLSQETATDCALARKECEEGKEEEEQPRRKRGQGKPQRQVQRQQIVLLINEEMSSWHVNQSVISHLGTLSNMMAKYYPRFVGLVLLFEASWDVRQGMTGLFGENRSEEKPIVQMVTRGNIHNYVDRKVLLRELGGLNTSVPCHDTFADAVLRHWYLTTSYMSLREAQERPLWQLPPLFVNWGDWDLLQRRRSHAFPSPYNIINNSYCSNSSGVKGSPPLAPELIGRHLDSSGNFSMGTSAHRSQTYYTCSEDEGFCSVISEAEELPHALGGSGLTPRETHVDPRNVAVASSSATTLAWELQNERELRIAAEQQLRKLRLGVTLDLRTATEVERALARMHAEVNVLIGNIIVRARAAAANDSPPTLSQLLSLTLSALETSAHRPQRVSAMKFAVPVQQETEKVTSCCCCM